MRTSKNIIIKVTLTVFFCSMLAAVSYATSSTTSIYINNEKVVYSSQSGMPFTDEKGNMQVPLRATMEAYGCKTTWSEKEQTVTLSKQETIVKVPIGKPYLSINGIQKNIATSAMIKDGRTYLPIRPVLESFGATVSWDEAKNAVMINKEANAFEQLDVHFIDVGQADAILIDNQDFEVLIDAGNNKDGQTVVSYLKPYLDGPLDLVIGTHPDADHIGGLDDVLNAYNVSKIIDSGDAKDTKTYEDYWTAVKSEPNCDIVFDENLTIDLGNNATLTIIETGDGYEDSNNNSVVAELNYGDISLLLTGDMENSAEQASLSKFHKVNVLKAGHHGSATSSSQNTLNILQPDYVVISAGTNNSYGHPHQAVLQRYLDSGATVYGTFRSGTIIMSTDGNTVSFNTNRNITLSDAGAAA
ncbi:MAG: stalk domain-containing protein [Anaerotignum sp.]